jgi:hypothetical protein
MNDYNSCFDCGTYLGQSIGIGGRCSTCHQTNVIQDQADQKNRANIGSHIGFGKSAWNVAMFFIGAAIWHFIANDLGWKWQLGMVAACPFLMQIDLTSGE